MDKIDEKRFFTMAEAYDGMVEEIGFINVDVFLKHHLWCAIGGQKTL